MILYLPGTGGSFLRRALSLSNRSIVSSPDIHINVNEKFKLFDNWNPLSWKQGESQHRPLYRLGEQDFCNFEETDLWLVDAWHPDEFYQHEQTGQCWELGSWPGVIFITVSDFRREFIEYQQRNKVYSLDWDKEQHRMQILQQRYADKSVNINFDSMLNKEEFMAQIVAIDNKFNLELDLNLVELLWEGWFEASNKVWKIN